MHINNIVSKAGQFMGGLFSWDSTPVSDLVQKLAHKASRTRAAEFFHTFQHGGMLPALRSYLGYHADRNIFTQTAYGLVNFSSDSPGFLEILANAKVQADDGSYMHFETISPVNFSSMRPSQYEMEKKLFMNGSKSSDDDGCSQLMGNFYKFMGIAIQTERRVASGSAMGVEEKLYDSLPIPVMHVEGKEYCLTYEGFKLLSEALPLVESGEFKGLHIKEETMSGSFDERIDAGRIIVIDNDEQISNVKDRILMENAGAALEAELRPLTQFKTSPECVINRSNLHQIHYTFEYR